MFMRKLLVECFGYSRGALARFMPKELKDTLVYVTHPVYKYEPTKESGVKIITPLREFTDTLRSRWVKLENPRGSNIKSCVSGQEKVDALAEQTKQYFARTEGFDVLYVTVNAVESKRAEMLRGVAKYLEAPVDEDRFQDFIKKWPKVHKTGVHVVSEDVVNEQGLDISELDTWAKLFKDKVFHWTCN